MRCLILGLNIDSNIMIVNEFNILTGSLFLPLHDPKNINSIRFSFDLYSETMLFPSQNLQQ